MRWTHRSVKVRACATEPEAPHEAEHGGPAPSPRAAWGANAASREDESKARVKGLWGERRASSIIDTASEGATYARIFWLVLFALPAFLVSPTADRLMRALGITSTITLSWKGTALLALGGIALWTIWSLSRITLRQAEALRTRVRIIVNPNGGALVESPTKRTDQYGQLLLRLALIPDSFKEATRLAPRMQ